jgi:thioredoxin 1
MVVQYRGDIPRPRVKDPDMLTRRPFMLTAIGAVLGLVAFDRAPAFAIGRPFSAAAFAEAKRAGKPILIEVSATWCPVCRVQKTILAPLLAQPRFSEILVMEIDFDRDKDALRLVNARIQSTLIIYRGEDEMGRSLGDTNPQSLESLLTMAL